MSSGGWKLPTAHTSSSAIATTSRSLAGHGAGTSVAVQARPSQCSATGVDSASGYATPTAQASLEATASTASSSFQSSSGFGLGTTVQDEPSHSSTSVLVTGAWYLFP